MYRRLRRGKGFGYLDSTGKAVRDPAIRAWFASLAIPPAWTEVVISEDPEADLLATGRDEKGRKQYRYHPRYAAARAEQKFDRMLRFAEQLTPMRRTTAQHLRKRKLGREKVLACMVRLLDAAYFRPGSPRYTAQNRSYGLTTLQSRHLEIDGDELIFRYRGKSGQLQERHVISQRLARIVAELDEAPGRRIFKYFDDAGVRHEVESADLNAYIHEVMGDEFSAKDFRTWAGTSIAAMTLSELATAEPPTCRLHQDRHIVQAVKAAAGRLGNTPTVCRGSYIDDRILGHYRQGRTLHQTDTAALQAHMPDHELSDMELALMALLRHPLVDASD